MIVTIVTVISGFSTAIGNSPVLLHLPTSSIVAPEKYSYERYEARMTAFVV